MLFLNGGPIDDIDSYWHVSIGRQIMESHSLNNLGTEWLGASPPQTWTTSQWLSEVAMALAVQHWGWAALSVGRVLLVSAILATLFHSLFTLNSSRAAAWAFCLSSATLPGLAQSRPQTVSLLFLTLLARWCYGLIAQRRHPSLWLVALASVIWAQLHGLWILAPAAFVLVAIGLRLDGAGWGDRYLRTSMLAVLYSLAGVINPLRFHSFMLPLEFRGATGAIGEWRATTFDAPYTIAFGLSAITVFAGWGLARGRVSRVEIIWTLAWTIFGAMAMRNVAPATLMLAPMVAHRIQRSRTWFNRSTLTSMRESRTLAAATLAVAAGGILLTVQHTLQRAAEVNAPAVNIARRLAERATAVRVFNDYNTSGALIAFGGGRPRLVVDGRADLWGDAYVRDVIGAAELEKGWDKTVNGFAPDVFVIRRDAPITVWLKANGWRATLRDGQYALYEHSDSHPAGRDLG